SCVCSAAATRTLSLHDALPICPDEVIVMVPDIEAYAPHIEAVFGAIEPDDPRHIPFSLADQGLRARDPLLQGLEILLDLPQGRRSEEHTSELQSRENLVCRLLL